MTEYLKAQKNDKNEIIDLINYVFSVAYRPHDFARLHPKAYADEVDGLGAEHYIVKEDGVIRAVIADRLLDMVFGDKRLKVGYIGSVAVHPRCRGKGYMKELMRFVTEDAKKMGVQLLALGGQRQRYQYFGFENAGIVYRFNVSQANVRHALGEVDASPFSFRKLEASNRDDVRFVCELNGKKLCRVERSEEETPLILKTWDDTCFVILKNGEPAGYCYGTFRELVLRDDADYPAAVKALFLKKNETVSIWLPAHERDKIAFLSSICENYQITCCEKISVLDFPAVVSTLLTLKAGITTLTDGEKTFDVDGACFRVTVKNNRVSVVPAEPDGTTIRLGHNEAEIRFFDLDGFLSQGDTGNWFPLPFSIDTPDTF